MLGNRHGGIGRYVSELTKRILELDPINQYFLFFNQNNVDYLDIENLKNFSQACLVPTKIRHYSLAEQLLFPRILNKYKLNLVHFPNFNVPLRYKAPFVVTIHDMVHHKIGGAKKSHILHFQAYKKIIKNAALKSEYVITVSESSKKDICEILKISADKVKVIYEGPFLTQLANEKQVVDIKRQFMINRPYFLFVGVLERKKNLMALTQGFDLFLRKFKYNFDLVIAGQTDKHYPTVKRQALNIKFRDHLIFTDFVNDQELAALYQGAYAFVSASLHEGFGLPGVEAMQFGLPLVVSNIDVFNEIYDNAAIYFDPHDLNDIAEKMFLVVRDNQFYLKLRQQSFARGQLFDWEETAQKTLEIYKTTF